MIYACQKLLRILRKTYCWAIIFSTFTILFLASVFNVKTKELNSRVSDSFRSNSTIIFAKTSTEPLNGYELCAVYAAAFHNPKSLVVFYSATAYELPESLMGLRNIRFKFLDFENAFKDTPLDQWYASKQWNLTTDDVKRVRFLSNAVRIAFLYKYGGAYLDTDIICLKSLETLSNAIAYQNVHELNGAFLMLQAKHPLSLMVMRWIADNFDYTQKSQQYGPMLLTRMVKKYKKQKRSDWPGIQVMKSRQIYPIGWWWAQILFQPVSNLTSYWRKQLSGAYTLHLWHNRMREFLRNPNLKLGKDAVLCEIIRKHCEPVLQFWDSEGSCS